MGKFVSRVALVFSLAVVIFIAGCHEEFKFKSDYFWYILLTTAGPFVLFGILAALHEFLSDEGYDSVSYAIAIPICSYVASFYLIYSIDGVRVLLEHHDIYPWYVPLLIFSLSICPLIFSGLDITGNIIVDASLASISITVLAVLPSIGLYGRAKDVIEPISGLWLVILGTAITIVASIVIWLSKE